MIVDDLPDTGTAGLVWREYTVRLLVPSRWSDLPSLDFKLNHRKALEVETTRCGGPQPAAAICDRGLHVIDENQAEQGDCGYCEGEAERAHERRLEDPGA